MKLEFNERNQVSKPWVPSGGKLMWKKKIPRKTRVSCSWVWVYVYWVVGSSSSSSSDPWSTSFSIRSMVIEFERLKFHVDYLSISAWKTRLSETWIFSLNSTSHALNPSLLKCFENLPINKIVAKIMLNGKFPPFTLAKVMSCWMIV